MKREYGEEGRGREDPEEMDASEMSAIDSFAQTQYSKFSKYYSKMG